MAKQHTTILNGEEVSALCEDCWNELTPEKRWACYLLFLLQHYVEGMEKNVREFTQEERDELREAVLSEQ